MIDRLEHACVDHDNATVHAADHRKIDCRCVPKRNTCGANILQRAIDAGYFRIGVTPDGTPVPQRPVGRKNLRAFRCSKLFGASVKGRVLAGDGRQRLCGPAVERHALVQGSRCQQRLPGFGVCTEIRLELLIQLFRWHLGEAVAHPTVHVRRLVDNDHNGPLQYPAAIVTLRRECSLETEISRREGLRK